jgi:uncharacterized damage-inducible protein DinB
MSGMPARVAVLESGAGTRPCAPLVQLLDDLATVILPLSPHTYTARLLPGLSGSIGEHVRHVLDHVAAFAGAASHTVLTYDRRARGTLVEADTAAALRAIMRLNAALDEIRDEQLDTAVTMSALAERGAPPILTRSTRRRELAFVISHTVHHQALIAMLLAVAGERTPDHFGLAPSTPPRA